MRILSHFSMFPLLLSLLSSAAFSDRRRGPEGNNLVLVTIDTLRKDRLGCYGGQGGLTPILDELARSGTRFEEAHTPIPLTCPAMSSMLTGRSPRSHGSTRNGLPIGEGVPTLATLLKRRGFTTAGFVSNWTLRGRLSGLNIGFDRYHDAFDERRWMGVFNGETPADRLNEHVIRWLRGPPTEPFFLWVHYTDPHAPYTMHAEFSDVPGEGVQRRYNSEVAFVDREIGSFLKALGQVDLRRPLFLGILADHGESLGEHGYVGHGRQVYDPMMRIPLIFVGPGIPAGAVRKELATLTDVAPTVLELQGLPTVPSMEGRSLAPLLRGDGAPFPRERLFMETHPGAVPRLSFFRKLAVQGDPSHIALYEPPWKVILRPGKGGKELYNTRRDPEELRNLCDREGADPAHRAVAERAANRLRAWNEGQRSNRRAPGRNKVTEKDREALKDLGYIGSP